MDPTLAGRQTDRVAACPFDFAPDGPASAEKNERPPHGKEYWAIPPAHSAELVAAREEVLAVYQRALDPACPVICRDETSQQLVGETRGSLPVAPGPPPREDDEYTPGGGEPIGFCFPRR